MARSSVVSELGFIVSFVLVRAIYCFLNQSCEPFLELPAHPNKAIHYTLCTLTWKIKRLHYRLIHLVVLRYVEMFLHHFLGLFREVK